MSRLVVGCMSGTSLDAIDAALVEIEGHGLEMHATIVDTASLPLGEVGVELRRLATGARLSAADISRVSQQFANFHTLLVRELADGRPLHLIAVHGQTVFHAPPASWQLFNPNPLAHALQTPVIFDLRGADLAAGGQGAPLSPLADFILFREPGETRAIINLGGFGNFTFIPPQDSKSTADWLQSVSGGDICSCNQLLDGIARARLDAPYDDGGAAAAVGNVDESLLHELVGLLQIQQTGGRSLGSGDELTVWARGFSSISAEDLARTACTAIASVIGGAFKAKHVIVAGGGVKNLTLLRQLRASVNAPLDLSDRYGIPAQYREAAIMAVLGALCQDRVPITLQPVTGAKQTAIAGSWRIP